MTNIHCLPFAELKPEHRLAWSTLLDELPAYQNPFLTPDFAGAVAAAHGDIEVAILEDSDGIAGVFPFQRTRQHIGLPVGSALSNRQAVIARPNVAVSPQNLLDACRLHSWNFHQLTDPEGRFESRIWERRDGLCADLSGGFRAYEKELAAQSEILAKLRNRMRKIEREVGRLNLELQTKSPDVLLCLMNWKSQQYQRTNQPNPLDFDWVKRLLVLVLETSSSQLNPLLSSLYAGSQLVAVSYDLRFGSKTEAWFTAFDPQFAVYGPGLILLYEKLRRCADAGCDVYCFGPGEDGYKQRFATDSIPVYKGAACRHLLPWVIRKSGHLTKEWMRKSRLCSWANRGIDSLRAAKRRRDMR